MTLALDAQTSAADPAASVFVTANAGSGKTTTLVSRVARLLRARTPPGAILCVTYTKAAAAEMQRRLYQRLGSWSVLEDAALSKELAELDGTPGAVFDAEDLSQARALFARALETPGGLKIETIHAFCEKLLKRFPLEAGVSPRFKVLEDAAAKALSKQARDALALAAVTGDDNSTLGRAFAHFAVELDHGRFETLFDTIEARRADLADYVAACADGRAATPWAVCGVAEGVSPESLEAEAVADLDWEGWRAAAAALREGSANDQKTAGRMAAIRPESASFNDVCQVFCTKEGEPRANMATKSVAQATRDWLAAEQLRVTTARAPIRAARIARDTGYLLTLAAAYAAIYDAEKASRRALDFADLIAKARSLLATREDAAWVLYKLDGGIEHVLLDEAQDTSPDQWDILRSLTDEFFAGAGVRGAKVQPRTVFAVGDEKQSIYSFQGARPERFMEERDYFADRAREAKVAFETVTLPVSWRSTPAVLSFVDAVCAAEDAGPALDPYYGAPERHVAMRVGQRGCVDLWPVEKDAKAPERDAWIDPLDADFGDSARKRLAGRIAAEIKAAVERGDEVRDKDLDAWRPAGFGDFLILVRRREALFEEIIRALKQAGVPVAGADRLKLSEHIAFEDLRALARFALFPGDDLTVAALLRSPFCDVDETSLYDLAQGRPGGLYRALRERMRERADWGDAAAFLDTVQSEARARRPFEFFNRLLGRLDAGGRSARARMLTRLGREAEDAIDEFFNQVLAAEARGVHDLEGLSAELDASDVVVKRELEAARGEVRVMTVHGAKGLEAPVVYLPDTTMRAKAQGSPLFETGDGGFLWAARKGEDCPASAQARALRDTKTDQESLRLLYVALTRARDRIVLCGRVSAMRDPEPGSWWARVTDAFDRPEIAETTRDLQAGDLSFRRFGQDPQQLGRGGGTAQIATPLPTWTSTVLKPERGARWASPSNIAEAAQAPAPSPLSDRAGLGRFRRGDLIHKLFEVLPDVPLERRRDAAARLLAREIDLNDDQRAEMTTAAFGVLDDARFAAVFGPGSRAEAAIAGTAPGLPAGVAISGRLDRLVVTPERVLVVDYKTNRPAPDRIEDADPAYVAQMAVYVAVLRALYPDRPVEAALVWTDGPKLMPVPQDVIDAALESIRRDS